MWEYVKHGNNLTDIHILVACHNGTDEDLGKVIKIAEIYKRLNGGKKQA